MPVKSRPRGALINQLARATKFNPDGSLADWSYTIVNTKLSRGWTDSRSTDPNLPDWQARVKKCEDATTKLIAERLHCRSQELNLVLDVDSEPYYPFGQCHLEVTGFHSRHPFLDTPAWNETLSATAKSYALARFTRKYLAQQMSVNGMAFVGELRETLAMIRNPAKALRKKLSDYLSDLIKKRRRNWTSRKKWRKIVADTYLENAFGWQPLIDDTRAAASTLMETVGRLQCFPIRSVTSLDSSGPPYDYIEGISFGIVLRMARRTKYSSKCIVRGAFSERIDGPVSPYLAHLGFRWNNFVPTVWELLPWSFVVDYFLNVQQILEAAYTDWRDLKWSNVSTIDITRDIFSAMLDRERTTSAIGLKKIYRDDPTNWVSVRKRVIRESGGVGTPPPLNFALPPFDSCKWINLAALWGQHEKARLPRHVRDAEIGVR